MARSDGYNTKTRQLILDYLINNRQHAVSASNILEHLEEQGASPNPTTVYRYLDKLAGEEKPAENQHRITVRPQSVVLLLGK